MSKREAGKDGGWIGVDLDGTLAMYTSGQWAAAVIGKPIRPMIKRVKRWLEEGRDVRIFTARVAGLGTREGVPSYVVEAIHEWCQEHLGERLRLTATKDMEMDELWDDRCVQVEMNTGKMMCRSTRGLR